MRVAKDVTAVAAKRLQRKYEKIKMQKLVSLFEVLVILESYTERKYLNFFLIQVSF